MDVAARLRELNIVLPPAPEPVGSYTPVVAFRNLAFVSGQIARRDGHVIYRGKVGDTVSVDQAAKSAQEATLAGLAAMAAAGLLDHIVRVVKVTGFVASAPGFAEQSKVMNGCSDLLVEILGDAGKHARTTVGVAALPLGASVEVDIVFGLG